MSTETARILDENGFMLVRGCRLSREGVYDYAARQVYPAGHPKLGDPDRIIGVYRPEAEIRDSDSIESFKSLPFIDEHQMLAGDTNAAKYPEDMSTEEYGVDGVLTDNVYFDDSDKWLKGDLKVWGREAQKRVSEGKDDLSMGMNCKFLLKSGNFQGKEYEVIQIHLRGNHLANVDEARVDGARILDSRCFDSANLSLTINPHEESKMPKPIKGRAADSALEELKKLVPALQSIIEKGQSGDLSAAESGDKPDDVETTEETTEQVADAVDENGVPVDNTTDTGVAGDDNNDGVPDTSNEAADADASEIVSQAKELLAQIQEVIANAESAPDKSESQTTTTVEGTASDSDAMSTEEIVSKAEDAAVRRIYADNVKKDNLYKRLSNVVGAFDARAMDSKELAAYGIKKLKLSAQKGQEHIVLDSYLNGMASAQRISAAEIKGRATDSKNESPVMAKWLAEGAK